MGHDRPHGKILLVALLLTIALIAARSAASLDAPPTTQPSADEPAATPSTLPTALAFQGEDSRASVVAVPGSDRTETPPSTDSEAQQGQGAAVLQPGGVSPGEPQSEREASERAQPSARSGRRPPLTAEDLGSFEPSEPSSMPSEPAAGPPTRLSEPVTYLVAGGDTLLELAGRFGISSDTIVWANDLEGKADDLQVGQALSILPVSGVLHEVNMGDTVAEIAAAHGVEPSVIVEANTLADPDAILVGQHLVVPGGNPGIRQTPAPVLEPQVADTPNYQPAEVSAADSTGEGAAIVAVASQFAGYAYTWGGHAPSTGFDCTGFTWYVYGQVGLSIPLHDLWGQLGAGRQVSQAELQPGDLVFFENTYQPGLSHAGLYVGNRTFIHAASERTGVRYDSLDDAYWGPRYFGASRPW